jgi:hypothetical protein
MRLRSARPRNVMGSKRRMVEWSQYEVETKSLPWLAPRPHRVRQSRTGRRAPQQTRRPALVTLPTATAPDVDAFIRRWEAASGNELSNYQIFVGEVCSRIGVEQPQPSRVHAPLSRRETTLLVVHILSATCCCVIPAAVRAATRSATKTCNVRSALSGRRPRVDG